MAKTIVGLMPPFGRKYVEPFVGKGNIFWASAKYLHYEEWWINDLQHAPFFEVLRSIGGSVVVPPFTHEEYDRQKAAYEKGDQTAILLEPYFTFSGGG
jgi:site-specific DNA-adenine methylase